MTAEPLSHRAEWLDCMGRALADRKLSDRVAFDQSEETAFGPPEKIAAQTREAPQLLAALLALPRSRRRGVVAVDARYHSAPLASLLLDEAREHPARAEDFVSTAHLILDRVGFLEARPLRVSAYVLQAEAARRRQDEQGAESALAAASSQLWEWSLSPERAEYCLAVARLRKAQARFDEAFALAERAGDLYLSLGDDVAAAGAFLDVGRWCFEVGCWGQAVTAFSTCLHHPGTSGQVLAGLKGLTQVLVVLGRLEDAVALVRAIRRDKLPRGSREDLVAGTMVGQLLWQRALPRSARRELVRSFHGLLSLGHREEALDAGLALLVAGARDAAELAGQLVPLVPAHWPRVKAALTELIARGHLSDEGCGTLGRFLYFVGGRDDI